MLWKEFIQRLKVTDDDPLLKQSVFTDLVGLLVKDNPSLTDQLNLLL